MDANFTFCSFGNSVSPIGGFGGCGGFEGFGDTVTTTSSTFNSEFGSFNEGRVPMEDDLWVATYDTLTVMYKCFSHCCNHQKNSRCKKCGKNYCENNLLYLRQKSSNYLSEVKVCKECYEKNKTDINSSFTLPPFPKESFDVSTPPYKMLSIMYGCYCNRCNHDRDTICTKCRQNFCYNNVLYLRPKNGRFQSREIEVCRQCYEKNKATISRVLKFA